MFVAGAMARVKLQTSQSKMKELYDCCAVEFQEFAPGDQVSAVMPLVSSPFKAKFTGVDGPCLG